MEKKKMKDNPMPEEGLEDEPKDGFRPNLKTLVEHVNILKRSKGMGWIEFENKVHVSQKTVSSWNPKTKDEKSQKGSASMPKLDKILKIADYFNVSIDWLLGFSTDRESSPVPVTYKEWIATIEKYLEDGAVKPFYRPELDYSGDDDEDAQEEMKAAIEKRMSGSFQSALPPSRAVPIEDDFRNYGYDPVYIYKPHPDSIYDVSEDMDGVYPDVLEITDTFLRTVIACLHYYKVNKPGKYYESFRESVIKQYGGKKVLKLDVYELRASTYLKETAQDRKLFKEYNTVSGRVFGKYKGIREINEKELGRIWKELEFWKEKWDGGKIKTVTQLRDEYFEKRDSQTAGDDAGL